MKWVGLTLALVALALSSAYASSDMCVEWVETWGLKGPIKATPTCLTAVNECLMVAGGCKGGAFLARICGQEAYAREVGCLRGVARCAELVAVNGEVILAVSSASSEGSIAHLIAFDLDLNERWRLGWGSCRVDALVDGGGALYAGLVNLSEGGVLIVEVSYEGSPTALTALGGGLGVKLASLKPMGELIAVVELGDRLALYRLALNGSIIARAEWAPSTQCLWVKCVDLEVLDERSATLLVEAFEVATFKPSYVLLKLNTSTLTPLNATTIPSEVRPYDLVAYSGQVVLLGVNSSGALTTLHYTSSLSIASNNTYREALKPMRAYVEGGRLYVVGTRLWSWELVELYNASLRRLYVEPWGLEALGELVACNGCVFMAGSLVDREGLSLDAFIACFDGEGRGLWNVTYGGPEDQSCFAAVGLGGSIAVGVNDVEGALVVEVWPNGSMGPVSPTLEGRGVDMAHARGRVYVLMERPPLEVYVAVFEGGLTSYSELRYADVLSAYALDVGPHGEVYLLCCMFGGRLAVCRYDGTHLMWAYLGLSLEEEAEPVGISASSDRVYVAYKVDGESYLTCLSLEGDPLWVRLLDVDVHSLEAYEDEVYVSGVRGGHLVAEAFNGSGALLWRLEEAVDVVGAELEAVSSSELYVAGPSRGDLALCKVSRAVNFTLRLREGWSLVSAPVKSYGLSVSSIQGAITAYTWDPMGRRYVHVDALTPGRGYWVYVVSEVEATLRGSPISEVEVELRRGWNLVGSAMQPSTVKVDGVEREVLIWSPESRGYEQTWTLEPGWGGWVWAERDTIALIGPRG